MQDFQDFIRRIFGNTFKMVPGISLDLFRYPGVSKNKKSWFWGGGLDMSKNPEIIEMWSLGFSHKQIDKLIYQIEAE